MMIGQVRFHYVAVSKFQLMLRGHVDGRYRYYYLLRFLFRSDHRLAAVV